MKSGCEWRVAGWGGEWKFSNFYSFLMGELNPIVSDEFNLNMIILFDVSIIHAFEHKWRAGKRLDRTIDELIT